MGTLPDEPETGKTPTLTEEERRERRNARWRARYAARTEEQKKRDREMAQAWRKANPEKVKAQAHRQYWNNVEKLRPYKRILSCRRRAKDPELYRQRWREYRAQNIEAQRSRESAYKAANKEQIRERKYGLTIGDLAKLRDRQSGRCAICGKNSKLVIDHDHKTGAVRGLLCRQCNTALGLFYDSAEHLRKAADYIAHGGKREA